MPVVVDVGAGQVRRQELFVVARVEALRSSAMWRRCGGMVAAIISSMTIGRCRRRSRSDLWYPGHPVLGEPARPHREVRRAGVAVGGVYDGCRQGEEGGGLGGRGRPRSRVGDAPAREPFPACVACVAHPG